MKEIIPETETAQKFVDLSKFGTRCWYAHLFDRHFTDIRQIFALFPS